MGFLIEVNFWKRSKIGTSCRNIGHFCSELNEFRPYSFPNCIVNTQLFKRSMEVLFYKNFRGLNKNWSYVVKTADWIPGVFDFEFKKKIYARK